jgi:mRNA interferase RelE/StbE
VKKYTVRYARAAEKDLERLPAPLVQRIHVAINGLADNPHPAGHKKLKGLESTYRLRVGDYRVLYEIHEEIVLVLIIRIRHRKDAY